MRKAFTLLELTIVLAVISLLLTVMLPNMVKSSLSTEESFKNTAAAFFQSLFLPGERIEVCVDFKNNRVGNNDGGFSFPPGYSIESLVFPGRLVSSEVTSRFCFDTDRPVPVLIVSSKRDSYFAVLSYLPVGEPRFYDLTEGEVSTLKDKVLKGRVEEWFSYYY